MSIIITQSAVTAPSSASTTTVQNVVDCTSQDIRKQLDNSGTDEAILIDYVNRVHLQILRTSRWTFTLSGLQTFSTVIDEPDYWIGATGGNPAGVKDTLLNLTDIRVIKSSTVFDRTNQRRLQRTGEEPPSESFSASNIVRLYRNDVALPNRITLFPPPNAVVSIEFRYFKIFPKLTSDSQILLIPDDYKDVMCAGVNWFASKYLGRNEDALFWRGEYKSGIVDMIRDANMFPRGGEFIKPDPQTIGVGELRTDTFWDGRL